jgi:hypothetical protein
MGKAKSSNVTTDKNTRKNMLKPFYRDTISRDLSFPTYKLELYDADIAKADAAKNMLKPLAKNMQYGGTPKLADIPKDEQQEVLNYISEVVDVQDLAEHVFSWIDQNPGLRFDRYTMRELLDEYNPELQKVIADRIQERLSFGLNQVGGLPYLDRFYALMEEKRFQEAEKLANDQYQTTKIEEWKKLGDIAYEAMIRRY